MHHKSTSAPIPKAVKVSSQGMEEGRRQVQRHRDRVRLPTISYLAGPQPGVNTTCSYLIVQRLGQGKRCKLWEAIIGEKGSIPSREGPTNDWALATPRLQVQWGRCYFCSLFNNRAQRRSWLTRTLARTSIQIAGKKTGGRLLLHRQLSSYLDISAKVI